MRIILSKYLTTSRFSVTYTDNVRVQSVDIVPQPLLYHSEFYLALQTLVLQLVQQLD